MGFPKGSGYFFRVTGERGLISFSLVVTTKGRCYLSKGLVGPLTRTVIGSPAQMTKRQVHSVPSQACHSDVTVPIMFPSAA